MAEEATLGGVDSMSNNYTFKISFNSDRKLTADELDHLLNALAVQVEDPSGLDGDKRASFTVSNIAYELRANGSTFLRILADGTQFMGDE